MGQTLALGSRRRWLARMGIGILLVVVSAIVLLAMQVDDWQRDLTTNRAATDVEAADPSLRPLAVAASPDQVAAAIAAAANELLGWRLIDLQTDRRRIDARLERRTRWLGFVDDVEIDVAIEDGICTINAASASRIGKGDLGQNPRNLRELFDALRRELPTPAN